MGIKTCQNCRRDYTEQRNFNWSCRTHQSEYSGEIWWCCGKADKHDAGCKFGKHVTQKDTDDESDKDLMNPADNDLTRKCMCCKELGHKTQDCPRDPNLKTTHNGLAELRRV